MREGFETIKEPEEQVQKKLLKSRSARVDEELLKQKIFIAIPAVGSFLIETYLFLNYLLKITNPSDFNIIAALSLLADSISS